MRDAEKGVVADLEPDSRTMLIAFGGLIGQIGIPPFEFFRSVSPLGVKKVFVRDLHQCWYQRGVKGMGPDIESVGAALARLIADSGVERTVTVGNSAGGYAALMFGRLVDADEVHAFVPQTFIDPELRAACRDRRWPWAYEPLIESGQLDARFADLRPLLADSRRPRKTSFHIYYALDSFLDEAHARHVADLDGIVLHELEQGRHTLVKELRDDGTLQKLLERALLS